MSDYVPKVSDEMWLAKRVYGDRLTESIPVWMAFFQGVTTLPQRIQRMRETITLLDMGDKKVGKSSTFAAAFERLYHEPLYLPRTDVDWIAELRAEDDGG
jgi:hypothetical protein